MTDREKSNVAALMRSFTISSIPYEQTIEHTTLALITMQKKPMKLEAHESCDTTGLIRQ